MKQQQTDNSDIHVVYHSAMALSSLVANDGGTAARHLALAAAYSRGYHWRLVHYFTIGNNQAEKQGPVFDAWEPW